MDLIKTLAGALPGKTATEKEKPQVKETGFLGGVSIGSALSTVGSFIGSTSSTEPNKSPSAASTIPGVGAIMSTIAAQNKGAGALFSAATPQMMATAVKYAGEYQKMSAKFESIKAGLENTRKAIKGRREEILTTIKGIKLNNLKDVPDILKQMYVETVADPAIAKTVEEATTMYKEVGVMIDQLKSDIEPIMKSKEAQAMLFNQFKQSVSTVLTGKNAPKNLAGIMGKSTAALTKGADSLLSGVTEHATNMKSFADGLTNIVNTIPNAGKIKSMISTQLPAMKALLGEAKQQTVALQSRIASKKDFSPQRIDALTGVFNQFKSAVPNIPGLASIFNVSNFGSKADPSPLANSIANKNSADVSRIFKEIQGWCDSPTAVAESVMGKIGQLIEDHGTLVQNTTNTANFKDDLQKSILPGDLIKPNFKVMYDTFKSIEAELESVAKNKDLCSSTKALMSMNSAIGKVNGLVGMLKTAGTKTLQSALKDPEHAITKSIDELKGKLLSSVAQSGPLGSIAADLLTMKRDSKALIKMAERILADRVPQVKTILAIKNRLEAKANSVHTKINTFKTVTNAFQPELTAQVSAFFDSLGKVAPNALEALMSGNAQKFEKTLRTGDLTTYREAASTLAQSILGQGDNVSVELLGKIRSLIGLLAGLDNRQVMGMWLANVPAQRAQMEKEQYAFASVLSRAETLTSIVYKDITSLGGKT